MTSFVRRRWVPVRAPRPVGFAGRQPPHAVEEVAAALYYLVGLVGPVEIVLGRPDEEVENSQRVGAHRVEVHLRRDQVALGLRHFCPVHADHALGEQPLERLLEMLGRQADVAQSPGVEAGVHQVQDGVLDAADVLVDRHPALRRLVVDRGVGCPRVAKT